LVSKDHGTIFLGCTKIEGFISALSLVLTQII